MNAKTLHKPDKLKVLVVTALPPPDYGGIANWSRIIRKEFAKNPAIELKFIDTTARYRAVTNQSLSVRLVGGSAQALRDTWRIYWQMRKKRPDLLHLCTSGGPATIKDTLILRFCKWLHVPSVIHYHMGRFPDMCARADLEWKLSLRAMRMAGAVISLDRNSVACLKAALPDVNIVKIPNMVDLDDIDRTCKRAGASTSRKNCTRLVFVGQALPAKGLQELVSACARLSDCTLLLDIIGPVDSGYQKELERIAKHSGNKAWLQFLGPKDHEETIRYLARADIFVLPSHTEGMPNVVLEAMACGRAILCTNVGGMPEMLDLAGPQECGVCVPPRDVPALTEAIRRLVGNPQLRIHLGHKARLRAEQLYSARIGCEQLVNLWRSFNKQTSLR